MQGFWFIHLDSNGAAGVGSERNRPCYRKNRPAQVEIARHIQADNQGGSVYLFPGSKWTQRVCQMSPLEMGNYVRTHGIQLV